MRCPQRARKTSQKGSKNPNWKGGYVWIWKPDRPNASKVSPRGYILEHRYIMEEKIGRPLSRNEIPSYLLNTLSNFDYTLG